MARTKTSNSMSTKKKVASVTAIVLCMALLLGGAFAWKDFSQAFTNILKQHPTPDVLLHDDFTPNENKDVYVENTGDTPAYVRISFHEFLQIGNDAVFAGTKFDDKSTWQKHLYTTMPAADGKVSDWNLESDKYYDWFMTGAQKNYLKGTSEIDDITYADALVGTIGANGQKIAKTSAGTAIINMATWTGWSETAKGLYSGWILDTDGYAYWSQKLLAGEATNLLLDNVVPKDGVTADDNMYYAIDVRLQATNATELHKMFDDMSDDAKAWLEADSAKAVKDSTPIEDKIDGADGTGLTPTEKEDIKEELVKIPSNIELDNEKNVYEAAKIAQDALKEAIANGASEAEIEDLARKAESLEKIGDRIHDAGDFPAGAVVVVDGNGFAKVVDKASGDTLLIPQNFPDSKLITLLKTGFETTKWNPYDNWTPAADSSTTNTMNYNQPSIDTDGNGKLSQSELNAVEEIYISDFRIIGSAPVKKNNYNVTSVEGIELFPNLHTLSMGAQENLVYFSAEKNPGLKFLLLDGCNITGIDITHNPALEILHVGYNSLTSIDLSKNSKLKTLYVHGNKLTSLDVSNKPDLTRLGFYKNPDLTTVNISGSKAIVWLSGQESGLTALDVSGFAALEFLNLHDCPSLNSLIFDGNTALDRILIKESGLQTLTAKNLPALTIVQAQNSPNLQSVDFTGCSALNSVLLEWTGAGKGPLTSINLTGCTGFGATNWLNLSNQSLTDLDISMTGFLPNGNRIQFPNNDLQTLKVAPGANLTDWNNKTNTANNAAHWVGNPSLVISQ